MKKAEKYIDINIPIPRGKVNIGFSPSKKYFKFKRKEFGLKVDKTLMKSL